MSTLNTKQPCRPGLRAFCGAAVVRATAVVAVASCFYGTAAAQAPAQVRQQEQPLAQWPQLTGLYLPAVVCRPDPNLGCLCKHGMGGRETSYPALLAEIATQSLYPEPPDAKQRHTEWRRQCGITSEEDTWP